MKKVTLQIHADVGLHARPAAIFVQVANQYDSNITMRNLTTQSRCVNAKSILNVLALGVEQSHLIELQLDGTDEDSALKEICRLVDANFDELTLNG